MFLVTRPLRVVSFVSKYPLSSPLTRATNCDHARLIIKLLASVHMGQQISLISYNHVYYTQSTYQRNFSTANHSYQ